MVPEKRKLFIVGVALAAGFALAGCAPAGVNAAGYAGSGDTAADSQDNGGTDAQGDDGDVQGDSVDDAQGDGGDVQAGDSGEDQQAGELGDDETTDELNAVSVKRMGQTVQNEDGFVLYRFDKDVVAKNGVKGKSNCNDACADTWPPALTIDGKPKLKGINPKLVGTITRDDGSKQLTIGGWPIYTYIGDEVAGSWKGQNVNGVWFVIKPDGTKNLTCLPKVSKPVAPPNDSGEESDSGSGDISY